MGNRRWEIRVPFQAHAGVHTEMVDNVVAQIWGSAKRFSHLHVAGCKPRSCIFKLLVCGFENMQTVVPVVPPRERKLATVILK